MARMLGLIGNRADLGARVLEVSPRVGQWRPPKGEPVGWGVGFYQSGEVLLRRRPIDERPEIDLVGITERVRTDVLLAHARLPTIGSLRTENTHPFRYRQWLFAMTGTIGGFEQLRGRLLESQPEFLRRNVRGDTDAELFFYLVLSFLHDAGHLDGPRVLPEHVSEALRAAVALVDRLSAEEGQPPNDGDILISNGEFLMATHRGGVMAWRVVSGRDEVEQILGDDGLRKARIPNIDTTHFSLVAAGIEEAPPRWTPVEPRAIVTLTRTDDPVVEAL